MSGSGTFGGESPPKVVAADRSPPKAVAAGESSPKVVGPGDNKGLFGQSQSAFGQSAFGQSSSAFGGSSAFDTSSGNRLLGGGGSTPFGAGAGGAFSSGGAGGSVFGQSTTFGGGSAFGGAPRSSASGASGTFGADASAPFGQSQSAFGASSTSSFGGGGAYGAGSAFGAQSASTPIGGGANTSTFGDSGSAFGGSCAFGGSSFGAGPSSTFSGSSFAQARTNGTRAHPWSLTNNCGEGNFVSISAMEQFGCKSQEELRVDDYANSSAFGGGAFGGSSFSFAQAPTNGTHSHPWSLTKNCGEGNFVSISAMEQFGCKSQEELRVDDYSNNERCGSTAPSGNTGANVFGGVATSSFGQPQCQSSLFGVGKGNFSGSGGNNSFGGGSAFGAQSASTSCGGCTNTSTFGNSSSAFGGVAFGGSSFSFAQAPTNGTHAHPWSLTNNCGEGNFVSISTTEQVGPKSQEDLRVEDYANNDRGGSTALLGNTGAHDFGGGAISSFGKPQCQSGLLSLGIGNLSVRHHTWHSWMALRSIRFRSTQVTVSCPTMASLGRLGFRCTPQLSQFSAISASLKLTDPKLLRTTSFVDGSFVNFHNDDVLPVLNPFDRSIVANVSCCTDADVDRAMSTASRALRQWRDTPLETRAATLGSLDELMKQHEGDLAAIITAENGKPLPESVIEVGYARGYINSLRYAMGNSRTFAASYDPIRLAYKVREPVGVVLAVTPWNFPLAMLTRKVGPALATGCTIVAKPSEETPLSALALAEICARAGVPPGVFSVLPTLNSTEVCARIAAHRDVRMIAFTGSTRVGSALSQLAAKRLQRTSMELGGLAPFIVAHDADVDKAAAAVVANKMRNAGQSCVSINRVYCHADVAPCFIDVLKKHMTAELVLGDGMNPDTTVGPLINLNSVDRVRSLVEDAKQRGAKLEFSAPLPEIEERNAFFPPTLLTNVTAEARVMTEEIFGPVIAVRQFTDYELMVAEANDTEMGLAGYVFSEGLSTSQMLSRELQVGMVAINNVELPSWRTSFGGVKQSGSGREGGGESALDDYTDEKYVLLKHG